MSRTITLFVLLLSLMLGACGTRGPLTLPPGKTVANPATQPQSTTTPNDLNTAKDPAQ